MTSETSTTPGTILDRPRTPGVPAETGRPRRSRARMAALVIGALLAGALLWGGVALFGGDEPVGEVRTSTLYGPDYEDAWARAWAHRQASTHGGEDGWARLRIHEHQEQAFGYVDPGLSARLRELDVSGG